jgi:hypothetical protein
MRRLALVALAVLISCGPAPAQTKSSATAAGSVTLKIVFHQGTTYRFSFHAVDRLASGTEPASQVEFTAQETASVQSVDSSGVAEIAVALDNVSLIVGGVSSPADTGNSRPAAYSIKIARDGRILSMDGPPIASKFPFRIGFDGSLIVAVLPDDSVKPGDSWTKTYDQVNPFGTSSGTLRIQSGSKYLRNETFAGVSAAVVETTSMATINSTENLLPGASATPSYPQLPGGVVGFALTGTTSTDVTTWIDPHTNRVLKTHVTAKTNAAIDSVVAAGAPTPTAAPIFGEADESVDLVLI